MVTAAYLGNSVTAQRDSYVDSLHQNLTSRWGVQGEPLRAGLGGVGSLAIAGLVDYLVLRHAPRICFVECSLADAGGATPLHLIGTSVRSILADLVSVGITPVVLHLPRADISAEAHETVVTIYDHMARDLEVPTIDVRFLGSRGGFRDGVHTSPELSKHIAEAIATQLDSTPPTVRALALAESIPRIRLNHIRTDALASGRITEARFRWVWETRVLDVGSSIDISTGRNPILGLYVIARSTSGVLRVTGARRSVDIQVWDEWCARPRIQFVNLPADMAEECSIKVLATDLLTGAHNAQGQPTSLTHVGTSAELMGVAVLSLETA